MLHTAIDELLALFPNLNYNIYLHLYLESGNIRQNKIMEAFENLCSTLIFKEIE